MANNIDYFEIGSPDPDSSKAFYGGLFGWKIGPPSAPAQYSMIDEDQGGLWDTSALGGKELGDLLRPRRGCASLDRSGTGSRR